MGLGFQKNHFPILHIPGDHHHLRIPNFPKSSTTTSIHRSLGQPTLLLPWFYWVFHYCPLVAGELHIATFLMSDIIPGDGRTGTVLDLTLHSILIFLCIYFTLSNRRTSINGETRNNVAEGDHLLQQCIMGTPREGAECM